MKLLPINRVDNMKPNFFHWLKMPTHDRRENCFALVVPLFSYGVSSGAQLGPAQPLVWRTARNCHPVLCSKFKLFHLWPHLLRTFSKRNHWDNSCVWHSQKQDMQAGELVSDGRKPQTLQHYSTTLITYHNLTRKRNAWQNVSSQTWLPSFWIGRHIFLLV